MQFFNHAYCWILNQAGRLTSQQWMIVLAVAVVVGFLCMRGYGSRSNY
jgi:hypothetical protein